MGVKIGLGVVGVKISLICLSFYVKRSGSHLEMTNYVYSDFFSSDPMCVVKSWTIENFIQGLRHLLETGKKAGEIDKLNQGEESRIWE